MVSNSNPSGSQPGPWDRWISQRRAGHLGNEPELDSPDPETLGRRVREIYVEWAREQPDPKPSWLVPWDQLDPGQKEVDIRIGLALYSLGLNATAAERTSADKGLVGFNPDWTIAPAAHLQEWLDEHGMSVEAFVAACPGVGDDVREDAEVMVRDVLACRPYGGVTAKLLEQGTGVSARFWLNLETNYRDGLARGLKDVTRS